MIKKILFLMLFVVVILLPSCTTDYSSPNTTITQSVSSVYQPAIPITQLTTVESQTPPETIIKIVAISGPPIVLDSKRMDIIDLYVKNTPASEATSISTLANYLISPAQNDIEKTRAIYDWVTQNISYDYNAFLTGSYGDTSAAGVLQSRSSVCQGYSNLFQMLAQSSGLSTVTISGWGKGLGYSVGDQINEPTNHAWNAVKINNGWYLIDSTWGAGYINQQNKFVRDFDDEYFLMLPDHFIYSHFPENQDWQLLDKPISKNMFADLPQVYRGFFSYGLSVNSNAKSMIESSGDVSVTVSAPSTVVLTALLMQGNRPLSTTLTLVQRTNNQYQINAICPDVGNYILRIYAKKSDDPGDFNSVLDYKIESNQASLPHASFPKTYGVFTTDNVYLNTPLSGYLAAGIVQHFDITVPNAGDVEIIMGDKWYPLTKQGESFVGEVNLVSGTLQVCAKLPNSIGQQYSVLIEYTVGS